MPKAVSMENKVKREIYKKFPNLYRRLIDETDGTSLFPAFGTHYMSIFIIDTPYETSRRLFECFLFKGELFILQIIMKCIKLKEKYIESEVSCCKLIHYCRR